MWRRPYQSATLLYFMSRYLPFVGLMYDLVTAQLASLNETAEVPPFSLNILQL